jgi:streptogramin lyase
MMLRKKITARGNFNSLGQDGNAPDMRSARNRNYTGRPEVMLSAGVLLALAGFCLACLQPTSLVAQTAHFIGARRTLGSGFSSPCGVAVDGSGNVFVADTGNDAVKEIEAVNGSIPASPTIRILGAGFSYPGGVALDAAGDVFVADTGNNAVKEIVAVDGSIPANPTVTTLATGFNQPLSVAVDKLGRVFVADTGNNAVKEIYWLKLGPLPGRYVVAGLGSGFSLPHGVAVDGDGNVFVADTDNAQVKEITSASSYTTINTLATLSRIPVGLAVDANGNVLVADTEIDEGYYLDEIVAVNGSNPANPTVITVSSGFSSLNNIAADGDGNVVVADVRDSAVMELLTRGNFGSVTVGSPSPFAVSLYFTFDTGGTLEQYLSWLSNPDFSDAGTGSCQELKYYNPGDICTVDEIFKPLLPGLRKGSVQLVGYATGDMIATGMMQGTGVGPRMNFLPGQQNIPISGLGKPYGMALNPEGDLYFSDAVNNTVTSALDGAGGGAIPSPNNYPTYTLASGLSGPRGVAVDGAGDIFVADYGNGEVEEVLSKYGHTNPQPIGSGFIAPTAVAVDGSGNVFVSDAGNGTVKEILISNNYATTITLASGFSQPEGIAIDANGNVFVTDYLASTVNEILAVDGAVPANPTILSLGSGFNGPWGIAVDANGSVIVADYGNNAVKELVAVNGVIPSSPTINLLGTGWTGPSGLAINSFGVVFVGNANSGTISQLDYADPPSLNFATTPVGSIGSDSPQSVTLVNQGTAPLNAVPPGLSVPTDFKLVPGGGTQPDCTVTFSLASGEGCNLSVEFAPVTAGNPLSESLVLTENYLDAGIHGYPTQSILLSGIGVPAPATLTSPAPSSTLGSSNVTFTWAADTGATEYQLWLGLSGPGSSSLYASGWLTSASTTLTTLPAKGATVYARLYSLVNGKVQFNDYSYTETTPGVPATMIAPTQGGTLGTSNVAFTWTAGMGATQYDLWLGLSGPGSSSLYASGWVTSTSTTVISLPAKGATVYARLYSDVNGVTQYNDYTYTEAGTPAAMSTPAASSTLGASNVKFTWTAGFGVTEYQLWLGLSGPGSSSLYASGWLTTISATVTSLPAKGATVYARLYSDVGGKVEYNDYTYTEAAPAGSPATMISPSGGSTLGTSSVQFVWTAGTGVTEFNLWLGLSGPGSSSLYASGWLTTTSTTVTSLPAKGATVYARLYSLVNGAVEYNDYTYTEQ